jgi:hypothetical protein
LNLLPKRTSGRDRTPKRNEHASAFSLSLYTVYFLWLCLFVLAMLKMI